MMTSFFSQNGKGNQVWFSYDNGNIVVKNPDQEILRKIIVIAEYFIGWLQGEDGELYIRSDYDVNKKVVQRSITKIKTKKKWWKF